MKLEFIAQHYESWSEDSVIFGRVRKGNTQAVSPSSKGHASECKNQEAKQTRPGGALPISEQPPLRMPGAMMLVFQVGANVKAEVAASRWRC